MRVELTADERAVLLAGFAETLATVDEGYRMRGLEWDRYDPANPRDFALIIRAHDDLMRSNPPWALEGTRADLEELLTSRRDGSYAALRMKPAPDRARWTEAFPELADATLDELSVCDAVLKRVLAAPAD